LDWQETAPGSCSRNLVYNIARAEQIIRLKLLGRKTPALVDG